MLHSCLDHRMILPHWLCLFVILIALKTPVHAQHDFTEIRQAEPPKKPIIERPAGTYIHSRIVLTQLPLESRTMVIRDGFRDGVMTIAGPRSVREIVGKLTLKTQQIKGKFRLITDTLDITFSIKATVNEQQEITGQWKAEGWEIEDPKRSNKKEVIDHKGPITGVIRPAEDFKTSNAISPELNWSEFRGPNQNFTALLPKDMQLVDSMKDARLVWRSEDRVPTGQGNATPFGRSGKVPSAFNKRTIGSGATPILHEGRIYLYYQQPVHRAPWRSRHRNIMIDIVEKQNQIKADKKKASKGPSDLDEFGDEDDFMELEVETPESIAKAREQIWQNINIYAREKYAIYADQILVCIDAETGVTLWKTTFPEAGANSQDHKAGPVNLTAVADNGRVYFTDTVGRVYALNAETGEPIWYAHMPTAGTVATKTKYTGNYHAYADNFCQTPVLVGNVLVVPDHQFTLYGFDKNTGKELWRIDQGVGRVAIPLRWSHHGVDYVITNLRVKDPEDPIETLHDRFQLIRVSDGKIMWKVDGTFNWPAAVSGDIYFIMGESPLDERKWSYTHQDMFAYKISPEKAELLWKTRRTEDPYPAKSYIPIIKDGIIHMNGPRGHFKIDLTTGEYIEILKGHGGSKLIYSIMADGKVLTRIDGAHGKNEFTYVTLGDRSTQMKLDFPSKDRKGELEPLWRPHIQTTNSYSSKAMGYIIVDGRLYLRGAEGLYCFDLRIP